jgi:hypothetical protein
MQASSYLDTPLEESPGLRLLFKPLSSASPYKHHTRTLSPIAGSALSILIKHLASAVISSSGSIS